MKTYRTGRVPAVSNILSSLGALFIGLNVASASAAVGIFGKGKVNRISTGSSIMVAVVDGVACLTTENAAEESVAAMAAILVSARLAENRLGEGAAIMNCNQDTTIWSVRMCAYGFQSATSTACEDP